MTDVIKKLPNMKNSEINSITLRAWADAYKIIGNGAFKDNGGETNSSKD